VSELTAIVPTRDRPEFLADCLRTLTSQKVERGRFDVLVIDDGSAEPLEPTVAGVARGSTIKMRCVRQEPSGLNAARNHAVAVTDSPLLAFLDDDTLVAPGWASAVLAAFSETPCAALGGRITLALGADAPRWLTDGSRQYLAELDLGPQRCWLEGFVTPVGANCAMRRSELDRVGGFREGLDRVGASLISAGETELFRRLRARGGRLLYDPAAAVVHRVPADRLTLEFFQRRAWAQGASDELLAALVDGRSRRMRRTRELVRAGRALPILGKSLLTGRGTANARLWLTYCRGRHTAVRRTTS